MSLHCDLFCSVVDNFGDAGVCWRLAKQLANERGWHIRLWIDDLAPLMKLCSAVDGRLDPLRVENIEVCRWLEDFPRTQAADVVIEAFACELPPIYLAAMADRQPAPVWINLEYLSAESWVEGCHKLTSPHPTLPLYKTFFFPGFTPATGGVIREGHVTVPPELTFARPLTLSLFCYDNPALAHLLAAWANGDEPIHCIVADGLPHQLVETWLGHPLPTGELVHRGALTLHAMPFLSQDDYDRMLGRSQLNFVRGEDSFVRAQWAERPFVWQIYPQSDAAHETKLSAFMGLFEAGLEPATRQAMEQFWRAWNGIGGIHVSEAWPAFRTALPALAVHTHAWAEKIRKNGDLASNLADFCEGRVYNARSSFFGPQGQGNTP